MTHIPHTPYANDDVGASDASCQASSDEPTLATH